jgi:hypothetical protein
MHDLVVREALRTMAVDAAERLRALVAGGAEIPYEVREPGAASPLCEYTPQTGRFVRERAGALRALDSFGAACAALESAGLAGAYLEAAGVAARCRIVTGNFFESVPRGADAYLLKWIIHDWDDDRSATILRNCRAALEGRGKVLLVERLMPACAAQSPSTIHGDLTMLVIEGGRERTEAEFRALLPASGLALAGIVPTRSDLYVIEAVPGDAEPPSNLAGAEPAPLGPSGASGVARPGWPS